MLRIPHFSYEHKYLKIWKKWTTNIFNIHICGFPPTKYILILILVILWHPNIFVYSFDQFLGMQVKLNNHLHPFCDICSSLTHFVHLWPIVPNLDLFYWWRKYNNYYNIQNVDLKILFYFSVSFCLFEYTHKLVLSFLGIPNILGYMVS